MSLQFGSNSFYPKFLTETRPRKPPRRRSRSLPRTELRSGAGLASQQKSFLCFSFARAGLVVSLSNPFFLLKGKENFFAGFCSERAGGGAGLYFLPRQGGIPPTPPFRLAFARTDGIFGGDIY